jgi:hypothetical protein
METNGGKRVFRLDLGLPKLDVGSGPVKQQTRGARLPLQRCPAKLPAMDRTDHEAHWRF